MERVENICRTDLRRRFEKLRLRYRDTLRLVDKVDFARGYAFTTLQAQPPLSLCCLSAAYLAVCCLPQSTYNLPLCSLSVSFWFFFWLAAAGLVCQVSIAFHGTLDDNLPKIVANGLIVPGGGGKDGVEVRCGSTYGRVLEIFVFNYFIFFFIICI